MKIKFKCNMKNKKKNSQRETRRSKEKKIKKTRVSGVGRLGLVEPPEVLVQTLGERETALAGELCHGLQMIHMDPSLSLFSIFCF